MLPVLDGSGDEGLQTEVARCILLRDTRDVMELARMGNLRLWRQLHVLGTLFLLLSFPARQAEGDILWITD